MKFKKLTLLNKHIESEHLSENSQGVFENPDDLFDDTDDFFDDTEELYELDDRSEEEDDTGYLIAKMNKKLCSGEDTDFDFC